jgi:hypothetical protein
VCGTQSHGTGFFYSNLLGRQSANDPAEKIGEYVMSLKLQKAKLDYKYLAERPRVANVVGLLKVLMDKLA